MRQDAKSLLARLNRRDFKYQEFPDPFADMELWPIFEALLIDERVMGEKAPTLAAAEVQIRTRTSPPERVERPAAPPRKAGLFSRYAKDAAPAAEPRGEVVNMRQFLGRLSDKT
ncbi:hypothetical protein [Sphingomonas colocasiae]|uniref:Transposase n=1 Tax=Sphingomonas colocasiae TaxID=1848973 RepID=A0ABS7PSQ5_9SPHN|nr:hypothetical protein [Sphingomonas colocasiae]MBY8824375.1 hypothetical protein [Sphingomonas colocasiae]